MGRTRGITHPGTGNALYRDEALSGVTDGGVWARCPLLAYYCDPSIGVLLDENFTRYDSTDDYTLTQATQGTAAIDTAAPGTLLLDSNSTTATQGANLQRLVSAFVPAANKDLWFEARVKVVDTYDKAELFIGLAASDTTIIATSAVSTNNHIGFSCVTDDGVLLFDCDKAGTGTTGTGVTLAEATYVKLGFFYDGTADTVQAFVNGAAVGSAIATTYIPKVVVYPSFVCQSGGTNDPILHIAGYRVFQLR